MNHMTKQIHVKRGTIKFYAPSRKGKGRRELL
jgi:hypothetical protein